MKYYSLDIYTVGDSIPYNCEVNQRTLDFLLGPWQDEGRAYRHDGKDGEDSFFIYKEHIVSFVWCEIFKECNTKLHLVKE